MRFHFLLSFYHIYFWALLSNKHCFSMYCIITNKDEYYLQYYLSGIGCWFDHLRPVHIVRPTITRFCPTIGTSPCTSSSTCSPHLAYRTGVLRQHPWRIWRVEESSSDLWRCCGLDHRTRSIEGRAWPWSAWSHLSVDEYRCNSRRWLHHEVIATREDLVPLSPPDTWSTTKDESYNNAFVGREP